MQTTQTTPASYKALVGIDLDETLLTDDKEISKANRSAIKNAIDHGVAVALISGRTVCGMMEYVESLDIQTPCCGAGGATVFDPRNKKILQHFPLSAEERDAVFQAIGKYPLTIFCHEFDKIYIQNSVEEHTRSLRRPSACELVEMTDMQTSYKHLPSKISMRGDTDYLVSVRDQLTRNRPDLNCFLTPPQTLEVSQQLAHKGAGLLSIARLLGIPVNKTIGIGDSENDYMLIAEAGIGVAMDNAIDKLKAQADYVAPNNNDDGVAWVFENVLPKILD